MTQRFVGIDMGAETIKLVELEQEGDALRWTRRAVAEHHKEPGRVLAELLGAWDWETLSGAATCGRLSRTVHVTRVPAKQAQAAAFRHLHGQEDGTVVSIGSHGFSVLELRPSGTEVFRENSRCSQGTGNFLRQLVERFNLSIEEASQLCESVEDPAPLSGRCPVILKTDMTHLANKGESRERILAGLYDAVCENVQVLIKPNISPKAVVLLGGVGRSARIRTNFRRFLAQHGMTLIDLSADDGLFYEALGSALIAARQPAAPLPALASLVVPPKTHHLDPLPALDKFLSQVTRMPAPPVADLSVDGRRVVLGFDIGSTGSKAVALDAHTKELVWQGYLNTNGNPVGAARKLMEQFCESPVRRYPLLACGATGSGREIVGSLLASCYGSRAVYVLNEIAAHAEGALRYDPRVDTIFEIGGQDAKYIRLAQGRVVDAAMNEACSAGTGSFIEEQGRKFSGIRDVVHLGEEAMRAECGVSLGQHCSVFMAEIIDEAVGAGVAQSAIVAGIYDSIIQNYLNRVKGSRSVGDVIFCQGMPFSSDALAAAVARQTGSQVIVPPNPGNIGAVGIGLLTIKELDLAAAEPIDPERLLSAQVLTKDTFVCKSVKGCGGAGNKCRIDRITTVVAGEKSRFTWGGGCSLYDQGTGKRKLPDLTPDPFRKREELVQQIIDRVSSGTGPRVAMTDEFMLKNLFPFFATFLGELGCKLEIYTGAGQGALKRGIEEANIPFCAPMQQFHGLVSVMNAAAPDYLFLPMIRSIQRVKDESYARLCPIVQASPDMLKWDLGSNLKAKILSPAIDVGAGGLESKEFVECCQRLAAQLGHSGPAFMHAYQQALGVQTRFDLRCLELGREALAFAAAHELVPVIVLGRSYTIYNTVLNSNVPAILREQGAIGIPVDCYPVDDAVPVFRSMYWGYGQRNLRAAHQVRRTPGVYALFCSNYSCGPDSFNLHFFSYMMEGKPFAIIETDGHSGDAGTKTRIEAFLYCVHTDRAHTQRDDKRPNDLKLIELDREGLEEIRRREETVLVPRMGPGAESLAACLRGIGISAEGLPLPTRETLRVGRRYTSGKECVPMIMTLGALLERIEQDRDKDTRFSFFMPTANGPCRFGVYNMLHKITLQRLGWKDRVKIWSPEDSGYFNGVPAGFAALVFTGFMGVDLLLEALYHARPVETEPGAAQRVYDQYNQELIALLEEQARGDLSVATTLMQVASGNLFNCLDLLRRAADAFAAIKSHRELPEVVVVGEIYVRCDPFTNDFVIEKLEQRGIRARFAAFNEWLEYSDYLNFKNGQRFGFADQASSFIQSRIQTMSYNAVAARLGWPKRTTVKHSLAAAEKYIRPELQGEAALTVGGPLHEWREGTIDGVVSVGPLECMPNKISEAQFFHVSEQEGLPAITLSLNGDPLDPELLDNFAFEVKQQFEKSKQARLAKPQKAIGKWWDRPMRWAMPGQGERG